MRWLCCFCFWGASVALHAAALFENGQWQVNLVQPANPEPDEWYASQMLVRWCEIVTGQRPVVLSEEQDTSSRPAIYIGQTAAFRKSQHQWSVTEGDEAVCFTQGSQIFLVGNNPVATRQAVGRFCERTLKVFFAFPGVVGADWEPQVRIDWPQPDVFKPAFAWREVSGLGNELSQEWAYAIGYGRAPAFSHGLYAAFGKLPAAEAKVFSPMVRGKRVPLQGSAYEPNPNLLAPQAAEVGAKYARDWFHHHPQDFSVPLGVNDTLSYDDRAESSGWYRDRPVRTDYVINYLNQVANSFWEPTGDLQGQHHALGTLAYLQTLQAPQVKVHPAIFPWVCADRLGCADAAFAQMEAANLAAWVKSGARRVGAYDYWYGVDFCTPRIHFTAQAQAIQQAAQAGVVGWYAEVSPLWAFDAPKLWLGAKLLENPHQSAEALLQQWFHAAYGVAALPMQEIYQTCEQAWTRDAHLGGTQQWLRHFRAENSSAVFNANELASVTHHLVEAETLLKNNAAESGARKERQLERLRQWQEAWDLVLKMREVYEARQAKPSTRTQVRAALERLSRAEQTLASSEQRFNIAWGAYGRPVKWAELVARDPRPEWFERVQTTAGGVAFLRDWASRDDGLGPWLYRASQAESVSQPLKFEAPVELSPSRYNQVTESPTVRHLVAPAGVLSMAVPLTVQPGSLWRARVKLSPVAEAEAQAKLEVYSVGAAKPFYRAVKVDPESGTLLVQIPSGVTQVIFKLSFEKEIAFESATLTEYQLPR